MRFRKKHFYIIFAGLIICSFWYFDLFFFQNNKLDNSKLKVLLVLTTHSCLSCVKSAIRLLRQSKHLAKVKIINRHFDKNTEKLLKLWYPEAEVITGSIQFSNDVLFRNALEKFIRTDDDWLIYMSTETLVARGWLSEFEKVTSGYPNSILYLCQTSISDVDSNACDENCLDKVKRYFGTAWPMEVAVRVLSEMRKHKNTPGWDWLNWCKSQEISVMSPIPSLMTCIHKKENEERLQATTGENLLYKATDHKTSKEKLDVVSPKSISKSVNPVYVKGSDSRYKEVPCDVSCFWTSSSGLVRTVTSENYVFTLSMEGSHYYPVLLPNRDQLLGTTSFDTEIPMPYFNWTWTRFLDKPPNVKDIWSMNNIQTTPKGEIPRILFMARNCNSMNNREKIVQELFDMIDSVSSCLQNKNVGHVRNKEKFMEKYMFYAAFENGCVKDYVTEKLWGAFVAGTLPIVYGPPNIWEHVPAKSILNVADFPSTAALREHVEYLIKNRTAYDEYHAWRKRPLPGWFVTKYNFTHVHSACRLCRWVAAKRDGLKWDKVQQDIIY